MPSQSSGAAQGPPGAGRGWDSVVGSSSDLQRPRQYQGQGHQGQGHPGQGHPSQSHPGQGHPGQGHHEMQGNWRKRALQQQQHGMPVSTDLLCADISNLKKFFEPRF